MIRTPVEHPKCPGSTGQGFRRLTQVNEDRRSKQGEWGQANYFAIKSSFLIFISEFQNIQVDIA